ncbi:MAG: NADP oxidoreductase [Bryobacteraceae bacterium]|nr:NADP oxidoreductase [Bryobacteraceae bacterium]
MTSAATKARVATVWLDGCSGCHMSFLDLDDAVAQVAAKADIVYGPLVDAQDFPEDVDLTLVEGAVSSEDDLRQIQKIRKRTKVLVALGDCAVTGNVPAMRNTVPTQRLLDRVYGNGASARLFREGVPRLLDQAVPLHQVVKVDAHIPGCPPPPGAILQALVDLLAGRKPDLTTMVKFG